MTYEEFCQETKALRGKIESAEAEYIRTNTTFKEGDPVTGPDGQPLFISGFKLFENVAVIYCHCVGPNRKGEPGKMIRAMLDVRSLKPRERGQCKVF